jgi:hypothetical protein
LNLNNYFTFEVSITIPTTVTKIFLTPTKKICGYLNKGKRTPPPPQKKKCVCLFIHYDQNAALTNATQNHSQSTHVALNTSHTKGLQSFNLSLLDNSNAELYGWQ